MSALVLPRDFEAPYGVLEEVSPLIRRIVANNPGPFTFWGTGTYVVGRGKVAVIDPGPDIAAHVDALTDALRGETVTHIVVTHTHLDHSPASAELKRRTGAPTFGFGPHGAVGPGSEAGADRDFDPDRRVADRDVIEGSGWTLEAVHTPGHTSNHLCFALREENALFSGDHVMGWSTTVVTPPDGNMREYRASLRKLRARSDAVYWPTHGAAIRDPHPHLDAFIRHRDEREAEILGRLRGGNRTVPAIVAALYADVDPRLHRAAGMSVLGHIEELVEDGRVVAEGPVNVDGTFRLK